MKVWFVLLSKKDIIKKTDGDLRGTEMEDKKSDRDCGEKKTEKIRLS